MSASISSVSPSVPTMRGEAMEGPRSGPDNDADGAETAARAPAPAPVGQGIKVDRFA